MALRTDIYSRGIQLSQLRELARSSRNNGEDVVEKYYSWREGRALAVAKGFGAAALSLLTAWLIPFLKSEFDEASLILVIAPPVGAMLALAGIGLMSLRRMDRIHQSFVRAMVWLQFFR
jgi:hypothetical protein